MTYEYRHSVSIVYKVKFDSKATESIQSVLKIESYKKIQSSEIEFDPKILAQRVADTIARVEQDNEEKISQMRNSAISKTIASINQDEKLNELRLTNMISSLPNYDSDILSEALCDYQELSKEIILEK